MTVSQMSEAYVLHFGFGMSWELVAITLGVDYSLLTKTTADSQSTGFSAFLKVGE